MKYIDADKLYEYLEQVSEFYPRCADNFLDNAVINVIKGIKTFITSLQQGQPDADLEKASRHVYESWNGGTMDDVRRDMVELGRVINARKEEKLCSI